MESGFTALPRVTRPKAATSRGRALPVHRDHWSRLWVAPFFQGPAQRRDHNRLWLGGGGTQSVVWRLTVTGRIVTIPLGRQHRPVATAH